MYTIQRISRQGQSVELGVSNKGLHLLASRKNSYKSEIVMRTEDLPLDWKRLDIAASARNCLRRLDFRQSFFIVGMQDYQLESEKPLYCIDGSFIPAYSDKEWFEMRLSITTYGDYQAFKGTRDYWVPMRTTEVEKMAQMIENYWT